MEFYIFNSLLEGVFIIDSEKRIVYCNDAGAELSGCSVRQIKSHNTLFELIQSEPPYLPNDMREIKAPTAYQEILYRGKKGGSGLLQISVQPVLHDKEGNDQWIVYFKDVSLEEDLYRKYRTEKGEKTKVIEDSKIDALTQIFNRGTFNIIFEEYFKLSKVKDFTFSLIVFDIDDFKKVNDTYGHHAGDCVLKEMSLLIKNDFIRRSTFFGRYGGEEFVVLLEDCKLDVALRISERICKGVASHSFVFEGQSLPITISMGVGEILPNEESVDAFFQTVDQASYVSKRNGKNQVNVVRQNK